MKIKSRLLAASSILNRLNSRWQSKHVLFVFLIIYHCFTTNIYAQTALPDDISFENNRPFAVVAGGSKGIGYAVAEALAKRKYNLILIARTQKNLDDARQKLQSQYHVQVQTLAADLTQEDVAPQVAAWCQKNKVPVKMLCNIAGMGGADDFLKLPADSVRYMTRINLEFPVMMTEHMLPVLQQHKPAYILNVASMAAFGPIPLKNVYSATKSGVLFFSYALRYQLKKQGISVSCLAPGPVFTKPGIKIETKKRLGKFGEWMAVPPPRVGELAVRKTLKKKMVIVPGTTARFASNVIRALPRRWVAGVYNMLGKE